MKPSINVDQTNKVIKIKTHQAMTHAEVLEFLVEFKKQTERFIYKNQRFQIESDTQEQSFQNELAKEQLYSGLDRILKESENYISYPIQ